MIVTGDTSGIDELEEQYQSEKVLRGERSISGKIVDAAILDTRYSAHFLVEISNGQQYGVAIKDIFDPKDGDDLVTLYRSLDIPPESGLDALLGKTIVLSLPTQGRERIELLLGSSRILAHRTDDLKQIRGGNMELPSTVQAALPRAYNYAVATDEEIGVDVPVAGIATDDDEVIIDLIDGWGTISVDLETTQEADPETPYERLVEFVGHGSVSQIGDGEIHITHISDFPIPNWASSPHDHLDFTYADFIMLEEDYTGEWVILGSAPVNIKFVEYALAAIFVILLFLAAALL